MSDQFGTIFVATQLKNEVLANLKKWFPTYLRQIEGIVALKPKTLKDPENYTTRNSFDAQAGEKLPKVVVVIPGTLGTPELHGRTYTASWSVGIGVAMAAKDEETADMYADCYGAAVRLMMLQNKALGGDLAIKDCLWLEENYDDIPVQSQTNIYKRSSNIFAITVENIATLRPVAGPSAPDLAVYPDFGQAQTVIIELDKEAFNG